jgi:hypothetical protein
VRLRARQRAAAQAGRDDAVATHLEPHYEPHYEPSIGLVQDTAKGVSGPL